MRHLLTIATVFALAIPAMAQRNNCKPDLDKEDKISKQLNRAWDASIYESGLGKSLITTSDWYLTLRFGRFGHQNVVSLYLNKYEGSTQNAAFESQYKGENGKEYFFAFTQGGDPMKFVVQSTSTTTKMNNLLGQLVTTISISTLMTDAMVEDFKARFNNGNLSAVMFIFAGDMKVTYDIKPKKAEEAKEKFLCFQDFNANNKIKLPEEVDLNDLQPNLNVPAIMPRDATTDKVSFTDVVTVNGATKDQLFNRARKWMTNYYKNEQFAINNKEDGRLTREGMFSKTYNIGNGAKSTDKIYYNISVFIRDGKYKFEVTDIVMQGEKNRLTMEEAHAKLTERPKLERYINQQVFEGIDEVLKNLKAAMLTDPKSDW